MIAHSVLVYRPGLAPQGVIHFVLASCVNSHGRDGSICSDCDSSPSDWLSLLRSAPLTPPSLLPTLISCSVRFGKVFGRRKKASTCVKKVQAESQGGNVYKIDMFGVERNLVDLYPW